METRNKDKEREIHNSYYQFRGIRVKKTETVPRYQDLSFMEGRLFYGTCYCTGSTIVLYLNMTIFRTWIYLTSFLQANRYPIQTTYN